jgi:bifunctional non-homologous end joining protein LigD
VGKGEGAKTGKAAGVRLTHPEKPLWPEAGVSKQDLLDHYRAVWERLKPFLLDRPLTLVRSPDGRKRFFQQHAWAGMPGAVRRSIDPADGQELLYVSDFDGLAALVQFGTVEIHGWGSTVKRLDRPDQITFDLDPDEGVGLDSVRAATIEIRRMIEARGLTPFVKTSGGKGFHITAPIRPEAGWADVERFASSLAHGLAEAAPDRFTATSVKAERKGRIFVDYLRNNPNATTVLPWSSRAKPKATVAVPITWEALESGVGPADFTIGSDKLGQALAAPDPWAGFWEVARPLPS